MPSSVPNEAISSSLKVVALPQGAGPPPPTSFLHKEIHMYRLAFMFIEFVLYIAGIVDTTRRRLRNDYPAMHGAR
jgi:hypothetical protein